jgi:hypothetical protein
MPWNKCQSQNHAANLEEARRQSTEADNQLKQDSNTAPYACVHVRIMNVNEVANKWRTRMCSSCNTDQMQLVKLVHKQVLAEHHDLCSGTRQASPIVTLVTGIQSIKGCLNHCNSRIRYSDIRLSDAELYHCFRVVSYLGALSKHDS